MMGTGDRFAPTEPCPLDVECTLPDGHQPPCSPIPQPCPSCGCTGTGVPHYRPTRAAPLPAGHRAAVAAYLEKERPGEAWVPGEVPTSDRNRHA